MGQNLNTIVSYLLTKVLSAYSQSVLNFLREKSTASRHKKIIKKFEKRKYVVPGPFHTFAIGKFHLKTMMNIEFKILSTTAPNSVEIMAIVIFY